MWYTFCTLIGTKTSTMKKTILSGALLFVLTSCLFVTSSCNKEVAGPKGDTGAPGKDGNANVSGTGAFSVSFNDWTASGPVWTTFLFYDKITNDIVTKGSVQVFVQIDNVWWGLPYSEGDAYTNFGIELGKVKLSHGESHGGLPDKPATANYRIVAISASQRAAHPDVDWTNYEATMKALSSQQ